MTKWAERGDASMYAVDITVPTHNGRRKLHTFATYPDDPDDAERWYRVWLPTKRERREARKLDPERQRESGRALLEELGSDPEATMPISESFRLKETALTVILDAARNAGLREIQLNCLKAVDSHYGWHIANLGGLPEEKRRHAKQALYSEILRALY
ncbi:MAG: hypothetical protein ACRET2_07965 [Steroidobacteraceae bacterium]